MVDRKLLYIAIVVLVVALGIKTLGRVEPPVMPFEDGMGSDLGFSGVGGPEPLAQTKDLAFERSAAVTDQAAAPESAEDRRVVRTGTLDIIVDAVDPTITAMTDRVAQLGGFVESSNVSRGDDIKMGWVTVRLPAARFDEAMQIFSDLAVEVESRSSNAFDVTRQFVDIEARLKNARAEEVQYQEILERAQTVEDILNVSRALNEVRSRIEQMEAELKYLSSQTDMATITISLRAEADTEVLGVQWRPLVVAKQAVKELLEKLVDAGNAVIRLVILLPVLLLWLVIFSLIAYLIWKLIMWLQRYVGRRSSSSL